jgi:hypothetical protein
MNQNFKSIVCANFQLSHLPGLSISKKRTKDISDQNSLSRFSSKILFFQWKIKSSLFFVILLRSTLNDTEIVTRITCFTRIFMMCCRILWLKSNTSPKSTVRKWFFLNLFLFLNLHSSLIPSFYSEMHH